MSYRDREKLDPPHRLLALDGGGIRGVLTLEVLAKLEATLQAEEHASESFVLADWFDYIGGTSTGAIIAAGLARGMKVSELQELYETLGPKMFQKSFLPRRFWHKYVASPIADELKRQFGEATTFGDDSLRTLLMIVLRNASTDSPWPLSNATGAKSNNPAAPDSNLRLPLWQLVRASTAAPVYFPAERVHVGDSVFTFQDGGVTSFNNPALQLVLMATMKAYGLKWETGEDKLLLVSVGTGYSLKTNANLRLRGLTVFRNATSVPSALMLAAQVEQDFICRVLGRCLVGEWIDQEVEDLRREQGVTRSALFTYLRYNTALTRGGLQALGLGSAGIDPDKVAKLDSIDHVDDLRRIGQAVAQRVEAKHFRPFIRNGTGSRVAKLPHSAG
ncbi:MAG: patatin-like phospholipase family protein [Solirubrobacteraceae bacterium]